jgi:predicted secreted hydrolase
MVYNLRRADGSSDELSSGTLVSVDGASHFLNQSDFSIGSLSNRTSPATDIRYPSRWRLKVREAGLDLEITPLLPDQELDLSFRYWEGAVSITGSSGGDPVTGQGYVELTGYE